MKTKADASGEAAIVRPKYYEVDGALRANANRAWLLAFLTIPIALAAICIAVLARMQPPTVIRIGSNGDASIVGKPAKGTIDDLYFWSNAVTLGLLVCAAGITYFEWRSAAKKEIVAATIIAELWNGRVSDKIEIVRRTEQFNQLVELQNQETERLLSAGPKTSEPEQEAAGSITKSISQNGYSGSSAAGSAAKSTSQAPRATESAEGGNANDGTARLQQSNLLLQRRVEALENSEGNLRQILNQTTLLLDEERRRNATLKGA